MLSLSNIGIKTQLEKNRISFIIVSAVSVTALIYSALRYNVFGGISWEQLPLYILNKAISFSGISLLTLGLILNRKSESGTKLIVKLYDSKNDFTGIGFLYIFIHILLSLILLNPLNYKKLYDSGGLFNPAGGISLAAGALTFAAFAGMFFSNGSDSSYYSGIRVFLFSKPVKAAVSFLLLAHLFFLGYQGWLTPDNWPGGMPPITLISFLIYLAGAFICLKKKRNELGKRQ
mgnify:CR=1 FL=1